MYKLTLIFFFLASRYFAVPERKQTKCVVSLKIWSQNYFLEKNQYVRRYLVLNLCTKGNCIFIKTMIFWSHIIRDHARQHQSTPSQYSRSYIVAYVSHVWKFSTFWTFFTKKVFSEFFGIFEKLYLSLKLSYFVKYSEWIFVKICSNLNK